MLYTVSMVSFFTPCNKGGQGRPIGLGRAIPIHLVPLLLLFYFNLGNFFLGSLGLGQFEG